MKDYHRTILAIQSALYLGALAIGLVNGLLPLVVLTMIFALIVLPLALHLICCRRLMQRTKHHHPEQWKAVSRMAEIRTYLFDEYDFGDPYLTHQKARLKDWLNAGVIGTITLLPTFLLIAEVGHH